MFCIFVRFSAGLHLLTIPTLVTPTNLYIGMLLVGLVFSMFTFLLQQLELPVRTIFRALRYLGSLQSLRPLGSLRADSTVTWYTELLFKAGSSESEHQECKQRPHNSAHYLLIRTVVYFLFISGESNSLLSSVTRPFDRGCCYFCLCSKTSGPCSP